MPARPLSSFALKPLAAACLLFSSLPALAVTVSNEAELHAAIADINSAAMGASMPVTQPDECPNYLVKCELIECLRPDRRVEIKTRGKMENGTRTVPLEKKQGSVQSPEPDEGVLQFPRAKKAALAQSEDNICRA